MHLFEDGSQAVDMADRFDATDLVACDLAVLSVVRKENASPRGPSKRECFMGLIRRSMGSTGPFSIGPLRGQDLPFAFRF